MKKIVFLLLTVMLFSSCMSLFDFQEANVSTQYPWNHGPWLVYGEDSTEVQVLWTSSRDRSDEYILFGESPDDLQIVKEQDGSGRLHKILLSDLVPGKDYYYALGRKKKDVHVFRTVDSDDAALKFAIFGDMQSYPFNPAGQKGNNIMTEALAGLNVDFYVQLGDLAEEGGWVLFWKEVLSRIPSYASTSPFLPVVGNHDYYGNETAGNYRSLFPNNFPSSGVNYYSRDIKNVHMVFLDNYDESYGVMSEKQKAWAEEDIRSARERGQDWIFIFMHHTLLTSGTSSPSRELQSWLVPLADKYEVDGVFFAHDHQYEHWAYSYGTDGLVYEEGDDPSGVPVHYWCSGGGGARSEVFSGVLTKGSYVEHQKWWDRDREEWITLEVEKTPWNENLYIDHRDDKSFGHPKDGKHYYHLPAEESFSEDNDFYGYDYGEQTLHYILVEVDGDNGQNCSISVHYPSGELLSGPGGLVPQSWSFSK